MSVINAATWVVYLGGGQKTSPQISLQIQPLMLEHYEPLVKFGIVYGYFEKDTDCAVYIGHATSRWSPENALRTRHQGHLNGYLLFDRFLRQRGEKEFDLRTLHIIAKGQVKKEIALKEKSLIRSLRPIYNVRGLVV
jgi:hypothetical protein